MSNSRVLIMADRLNAIASVVKKIDDLDNVNIIKICDKVEEATQFVFKKRPEIVFLYIQNSRGAVMEFLYQLYNFNNWLPYMIAVVDVPLVSIQKRVYEYGLARVFNTRDPEYASDQPVMWIDKIAKCRITMSALPCNPQLNSTDLMLKRTISKHLMEIGMSLQLAGFKYLVEAIILTMKNPELSLTGTIYRQLAEKYHTSKDNIERCTRTAIELTWRDTDMRILAAKYPVPEMVYQTRPSTKKFVCCMADYFLKEYCDFSSQDFSVEPEECVV